MTENCEPIPKNLIRLRQYRYAFLLSGEAIADPDDFCWVHKKRCYQKQKFGFK